MSRIPTLSDTQLERVARLLGDCGTGTDISRIMNTIGIEVISGESTKWRRIYAVFRYHQKRDGAPSKLIDFIRNILEPSGFVNNAEFFEETRCNLNAILSFAGLEYGKDGKFRKTTKVETLDEAYERAKTIQAKFRGRRLHPQVIKYCKPELMKDNYFHAVFEATKGLAQRIREMSSVEEDGARLVDIVFLGDRPVLAINTLQTQTERTEHKGFAQLLKGCFAAVRNPLAHEPKLLWRGEDDAADYLSLISLVHRKLDDAVPTGLGGGP